MVKCPILRGFEEGFKPLKTWSFGFYDVSILECPKRWRRFNHYIGVTSEGKRSEFVVRDRPRASGGAR